MKKDIIEYADFQKLDIRVGEIKTCEPVKKSKKLFKLLVDFGADYGEVQILSGIAEYYQPEDLIGHKYIFLVNLKPREMMGTSSNGMIFAADQDEKAVLLPISNDIPNGTIIR